MSTEPETTEDAEPGTPGAGMEDDAPETQAGPEDTSGPGASAAGSDAEAPAEGTDAEVGADTSATGADPAGGTESGTESAAEAPGTGAATDEAAAAAAAELSEAEAELAAQRELRERIERRKAEKQGPIAAGTKLSGTAADLLAAVRAVESGEKPVATPFREPEPAPRRSAPEPVRRPEPVASAAGAPAAETVDAVRSVLTEGGAPEVLAPQAAAVLGEGADGQLRADPWQLLRIAGVRPEQADGFARALLGAECGPDDERRGRALTVWLLEQAAVAGHTALDASALTAALTQRTVPDPDAAVQSALAEGDVLVFQDALETAAPARESEDATEEPEERPVRVLIGLERYALAEESLADGLARVVNAVPKESAADWESAAASASRSAAELLRAVAGHGLVLHTGGEASRAEVAELITAAGAVGLRAYAAAPTADGRDRLAAFLTARQDETPGTGVADSVVTVAGLLSGAEGPGRDAEGAFGLDLLVLLDAPQLDVEAAAVLVESLPDGARLVLSGDPGVLWSAGPGPVL
ncbi:MAG: hypothetical protein QOC85_2947, partial [Streptomyces sp.]|nr:hypothetical protein [Streptomyces sp.]